VNLSETPAGCIVSVADNGPGIPPEKLVSVFEPFVRLDPARTAATGTGLGLSIIRSVARAHGGDVVLENLAGGGLNLKMALTSAES
jgi:signal transduction histidine kinase